MFFDNKKSSLSLTISKSIQLFENDQIEDG